MSLDYPCQGAPASRLRRCASTATQASLLQLALSTRARFGAGGYRRCATITFRQNDSERRPLSRLALQVDPTAVVLHDAVADAQAQPSALPHRFGRKERVEDALSHAVRDA